MISSHLSMSSVAESSALDHEDTDLDISGTWQEVGSVSGEEFSDNEDLSSSPTKGHSNLPSISLSPIHTAASTNNIVSPNLPYKILSSPYKDNSPIQFEDIVRSPSSNQLTPPRTRTSTTPSTQGRQLISPTIPFHVLSSSGPTIDVNIDEITKAPSSFQSDSLTSPTASMSNMSWSSVDFQQRQLSTDQNHPMSETIDENDPKIILEKTFALEEANMPNQRYLRALISTSFYFFIIIVLTTSLYATYIYYSAILEANTDTGLVIRDAVAVDVEQSCTPFYALISFMKLPDSISKSFYSMKKCAA
jgi:hypothetical protein